MYGADRLKTPLLRSATASLAKDGEFEPVSWDEAFDVMARAGEAGAEGEGATASACLVPGSGRSSRVMPRHKLMRAGFRLQHLDPECPPLHGLSGLCLHAHFRHGRADGLL